MILDSNARKPEIDYPTKWSYKIIGSDVEKILAIAEKSVFGMEYEISLSNVSKTEKWYSFNLTVVVPSEVVRNLIFQKLDESPDIKMVL